MRPGAFGTIAERTSVSVWGQGLGTGKGKAWEMIREEGKPLGITLTVQ